MQFIYKARYLARFDRFSSAEQKLILEAEEQIRAYYTTHQAPHGLRMKLLHTTGDDKLFEARASRGVRILWAKRGEIISFVLVGFHDDVTHYLRSLR